ncbi:hypothetical protein KDW_23110 [Dictyobacter vulcani]|uniref:Uncharacterized protein n=1 Tax=Dictyobacter vulcani TaxID=2607529 RepID=A0A5J4KPV3_9CHLR|nr:hypothetical protein KDW_23110 [Dictyobacter vulcani]
MQGAASRGGKEQRAGDARGSEPLDWGIGGCAPGISPLPPAQRAHNPSHEI